MPAYPNPVYRAVLLRVAAPFVPVWLFGLVLAVTLGQLGLARSDATGMLGFVVAFSAVVIALLAALAIWERRRAPAAIALDVDRVAGTGPRAEAIDFGSIVAIRAGGFFGCRVEARVPSAPAGRPQRLAWLYLTRDNAERVSLALSAWQEREAASPP